MDGAGNRRVNIAGSCPAISTRNVSSAGIKVMEKHAIKIQPAPDNHLAATPDCRVVTSTIRRVGGAYRRPSVRVGIISTAAVIINGTNSAPHDHFATGPYRAVQGPSLGRS